MAKIITLAELREEIRDQGDYPATGPFTNDIVNRWTNRAIAQVRDLLIETDEDYYTTLASLTTTAGDDTVSLPDDFYQFKALGWLDGSRGCPIRRGRLQDWYRCQGHSGRPSAYLIQGSELRMLPTPDTAYSLRMFYVPVHPVLENDEDSFDSINYFDELVIQKVLLRCDQREERNTADRKDTIGRLEQLIRRAASAQDRGEPQYLADLGDGDAEFY